MCDSHVPECEDMPTCTLLHVLLYAGSRSSTYFKSCDELYNVKCNENIRRLIKGYIYIYKPDFISLKKLKIKT